MAIFGSNTFEYESCVRVVVVDGGRVIHQPSIRVRHRDTVLSVLGSLSLGAWTEWRWIDSDAVYRLSDGTQCDFSGAVS